jgi:hypothetical protein
MFEQKRAQFQLNWSSRNKHQGQRIMKARPASKG